MELTEKLVEMLRYRRWADRLTYQALFGLPDDEVTKVRQTRWESIAYTLSHVLAVDDIFRHHLLGQKHDYQIRNSAERYSLIELWDRQQPMTEWYLSQVEASDSEWSKQIVEFEFVGGGKGAMSRADIVIHIVNHATYHRGLISDMMCQIPAEMPANDLPVFLRGAAY